MYGKGGEDFFDPVTDSWLVELDILYHAPSYSINGLGLQEVTITNLFSVVGGLQPPQVSA